MELYEKILCETIAREVIPALNIDPAQLVEMKCYQAIQSIRRILADDSLEDPECFYRIEEIVCALENVGADGGGRHDFG